MQPRSVEMGGALRWYLQGWKTFQVAPAAWIGMIVLSLLFSLLLSFLPLMGAFLAMLVSPLLNAGMLMAARDARAGQTISIEYLFRAFTDDFLRTRLLKLGAIAAGAQLVLELMQSVLLLPHMQAGADVLNLKALLGYLILLAVMAAVSMLILYAVPLVALNGVEPVEAMRASWRASLVNLLPLTLFGLIGIPLAFLAAVPMGLGLLVFLPVMLCAIYESFNEIFMRDDSQSPGILLG
jgi:hypothetical protein